MLEINLDFGKPNPIQEQAIHAFQGGKRIVLIHSGRQAGKSHFGARWLIMQMLQNPNAKHKLAAAVAPTYRMARVIQRKIEEVLREDPRLWRRVHAVKQPQPYYEFPNGWMLEVHSSADPEALRGPTFSHVWYDECSRGVKDSFTVLLPTLLAEQDVGRAGAFLGTTNPNGKQNWVYDTMYLKSCPPGHPDHDPKLYNPMYGAVIGSTWDNVENLSEEALIALEEAYGGTDNPFTRQEIFGEFIGFEGLVYKWDEANFIPYNDMPEPQEFDWVVGGLDFGFVDPTAAVVMGYKSGVWWCLDQIVGEEFFNNPLASELNALTKQYGVETWYADSANRKDIEELAARGVPVVSVDKPLIQTRIKEMASFTNNNRFKVSTYCPDVRDELQMYQYPDEYALLRDKKRNPIDRYNHTMDAAGYAIWSMRWLWRNDVTYDSATKKVRENSQEEREVIGKWLADEGVDSGYGPEGLYGE